MVRKSYRTLFKDPTGFKEKVLYCLFDLDKRIKELTGLDELKKVFSLKTHTHSNYVTRQELTTIINNLLINSSICYIKPFTVANGVNTIECEIEPTNAVILEDLTNTIFTNIVIDGNIVTFEHDNANVNQVYHLIYYNTEVTEHEPEPDPEPEETITIEVINRQSKRNTEIQLQATVTATGGHIITDGNLEFYIDDVKIGDGFSSLGFFKMYYVVPNEISYGVHTIKAIYTDTDIAPIEATGTLTIVEN